MGFIWGFLVGSVASLIAVNIMLEREDDEEDI